MTVLTQPGPFTSTTLGDGLAAYWKLDEASGVGFDSGPNALHLTDNNTVGSAAGQVGTARQFTAAQSESLSHADTAALRGGDHSFAWSCWVYFDGLVTARILINKRAAAQYEYQLYASGSRFRFYVNGVSIVGNIFGALATGVWYYVYVAYDAAADLLRMSINGVLETPVTLASGGTVTAGAFELGTDQGANFMSGRMDEVKLWNARILTTAEIAEDYANGLAGRSF